MNKIKMDNLLATTAQAKEKYGSLYKYSNAKELQDAVDSYFESVDLINNMFDKNKEDLADGEVVKKDKGDPRIKIPQLPALASWLGTSMSELRDYGYDEEYKNIIVTAATKMESIVVELGLWNIIPTNMLKFYLKNCHLWEEQSTIKTIKEEKKTFEINIIQPDVSEEESHMKIIEPPEELSEPVVLDGVLDGFGS